MSTRSNSASAHGLAWLLDPVPPAEFFAQYWRQNPLRVLGSTSPRFGVPSIDEVDSLIAATISVPDSKHGRLVRTDASGRLAERQFRANGEGRVDLEDVYRAYADGYSVVLNQIEQRSAAVAKICRGLEADTGYRVGANYYLTPPGAQGFGAHYDSHDVLIAQIHGTKTWHVGKKPYPGVKDPGTVASSFKDDAHEWVLEAGDVVYLPKGSAHQAVTGAGSSLHVTFGLVGLTWSDLQSKPCAESASVGVDLEAPVRFEEMLDPVHPAIADALCTADPGDLEEARLSLISGYLGRVMVRGGQFPSLDAIASLTSETVVARAIPGPAHARSAAEGIILEFPGCTVVFPVLNEGAIRFVTSAQEFHIGDIPGIRSDGDRVAVVTELIRSGVVSVQ